MAICNNCGEQVDNNVNVCPKCGSSINNAQPIVEDNGNILWGLLGCCIPIVGLVLFLIWKDSKPNSAKNAGIGAIVGVAIGIIYYIVMFALGIASSTM